MRDENDLRNGLRALADDFQVDDGLQERVTRAIAARRLRNRGLGALAATAASIALVAGVAVSTGGDDAGGRITTDRADPGRTPSSAPIATSTTTSDRSTTIVDRPTTTTMPTTTTPVIATTAPVVAPTTTTAPPTGRIPAGCAAPPHTARGDLDGDGFDDVVWSGWLDPDGTIHRQYSSAGDPLIGVCLTGDGSLPTTTVAHHESVDVIDLDGDGRAEILAGGTTAGSIGNEILVVVGGQLTTVTEAGNPVVLREGTIATDADGRPARIEAYGCRDVAGGRRQIVRVSVEVRGEAVRWTRATSRLRGATLDNDEFLWGDEPAGSDLWTVARRHAPEC